MAVLSTVAIACVSTLALRAAYRLYRHEPEPAWADHEGLSVIVALALTTLTAAAITAVADTAMSLAAMSLTEGDLIGVAALVLPTLALWRLMRLRRRRSGLAEIIDFPTTANDSRPPFGPAAPLRPRKAA